MKNYLKLGILLFGISLLLWNCEKENVIDLKFATPIQVNAETVSFNEAKDFFKKKNTGVKHLAKGTSPLIVNPKWETLQYKEISYTNALLTKANTSINRKGDYSTEIFFIKVNGEMKNVLVTTYKDKININGLVINAGVFFNEIDGTFIDAYKIEEGKFTKRLVPRKIKKVQKASFLSFFQSTTDPTGEDC